MAQRSRKCDRCSCNPCTTQTVNERPLSNSTNNVVGASIHRNSSGSRGGVIMLECQSAQRHYRELCAPDHPSAIHTNHLLLRRIMIVASSSEPTTNQINSGSLPTSAPPPTARSLTLSGIGNGCFTSCALPFGLVTTSRTAMNDVYRVNKLYFKPSAVISLMFSSANQKSRSQTTRQFASAPTGNATHCYLHPVGCLRHRDD